MDKNKTWGIIGLGWLGQSLSDELKISGADVWGTHRSEFTFDVHDFPKHHFDTLFVNVPPQPTIEPKDFVNQIVFEPNKINPKNNDKSPSINSSHLGASKKLIFISSTSVYGEDQNICTEDTVPKPTSTNGKWLLDVEMKLIEKFKTNILILRPGGLIGEDRHPVYSLVKRQMISGGNNLVNLIHREDLIQIIIKADKENLKGVINAVSPDHPKKSEYYNYWAKKLNLQSINFKDEVTSHKQVDSNVLPSFYKTWLHFDLK